MHTIYIPYFVLYILIIHNNVIPPPLHTILEIGLHILHHYMASENVNIIMEKIATPL